MRSSALISRIMRVVETDGRLGEGPALASEYAEAVRKVNARLDSVHSAIAAGEMSDAVRMMEDAPRLLDEINALDFIRLPDWEAVCERRGWERPPSLDRAQIERVLELSKDTRMSEPFLRMYRKAVRLNDNALAVKALRRLVEVDRSQNWMEALEKAERASQMSYVDRFEAARARGDEAEMDRISQEFAETTWRNAPTGRGVDSLRAFLSGRDARRRDAEGREDVELLRSCHDGEWNRALAESMLRALDALDKQGWTIPADERAMVDDCRRRCAEEQEAERGERRWNAACERLHAAVRRENTSEIREALALTEFLDRDPPEDLLRDARRTIEHEEEAKRRKTLQVAFCVMAGIAAVLGVSGWWLRQKLFSDRCEGEADKLEALIAGPNAVDRVGEALRRLAREAKDVYDDPRVNVYVGRLKTMAAENAARTNEIAGVLASLAAQDERKWADADASSVTDGLARVEKLLKAEDVAFTREARRIRASWERHCDAVDEVRRNDGAAAYEKVVADVEGTVGRLNAEIGGAALDEQAQARLKSLAEWRDGYGAVLPESESASAEVEKRLVEAIERQKGVRAAIDAMRNAESAADMAVARAKLLANHSGYAAVKRLRPHPVAVEDVRAVLNGDTKGQRDFASSLGLNVDRAKILSEIVEEIRGLEDVPAVYSPVGLSDDNTKVFAIAIGTPKIEKPDYAKEWVVDGDILSFKGRGMVTQILKRSQPSFAGIKPVDEIRALVDMAKTSGLSADAFENFLLKKIKGHLSDAQKKNFVENEKLYARSDELYAGHYPAWRRVQFLDSYFAWLDRLLPMDDAELKKPLWDLKELSNPISIAGVSQPLQWACQWDSRVKERNRDCARWLSRFPNAWLERHSAVKSAWKTCQKIGRMKVETAGCVLFDPRDETLAKKPNAVVPIVHDGVERAHPLYVLRRDGDRLALRKAFVFQKGAWRFTAKMENAFIPGEPLYRVRLDRNCVDAEPEIAKLLKGVPPKIAERIVDKIPFFRGIEPQK